MADNYCAVILAGGQSSRFGNPGLLKEKIGGKSILSHSLDNFAADDNCTEILVSANPAVLEWIAGDPLTFSIAKMKVLPAADNRGLSALAAAAESTADLLVTHHANRPNFRADIVAKLLSAVRPAICAVPVCELVAPVVSVTTITERGLDNGGSSPLGPKADHRIGHLMEHQQPDGIFEVQTPQAFIREDYIAAANAAGDLSQYADDSSIFIAGGKEAAAVYGQRRNFAIVFESDMQILGKLMGTTQKKKKDRYGGLGW